MYDPVHKRIIISRNVIFKEDECWNWDESYQSNVQATLSCKDESDADSDVEVPEVENVTNMREEEENNNTADEKIEEITPALKRSLLQEIRTLKIKSHKEKGELEGPHSGWICMKQKKDFLKK